MLCDDVCALRTNPACLWQVLVSLLLLLLCSRRCCCYKDMDSDGDVDLVCGGGGGVVWYENLGGSLPSFTVRSVSGLLTSSVYSMEYVVVQYSLVALARMRPQDPAPRFGLLGLWGGRLPSKCALFVFLPFSPCLATGFAATMVMVPWTLCQPTRWAV